MQSRRQMLKGAVAVSAAAATTTMGTTLMANAEDAKGKLKGRVKQSVECVREPRHQTTVVARPGGAEGSCRDVPAIYHKSRAPAVGNIRRRGLA